MVRAPTVWRAAVWLAVVLMGLLTSWYVAVMVALVNAIVFALLIVARRPRAPAACGGGARTPGGSGRDRRRVVYPLARPYVGLRANPAEAAAFSADVEAYLVPPENTSAGGRGAPAWTRGRARSTARQRCSWDGSRSALGSSGWGAASRRRVPKLAWVFPRSPRPGSCCPWAVAADLGGPALAPFGWLASLPGFSGMRAPARFALVACWGSAGLAALGASRMSARAPGDAGPGPGRDGTAHAARVVRGGLPCRQARGAPDSGDLPDAGGPRGARNSVAARVSRQAGWILGGDYLYTRPRTGGRWSTGSAGASRRISRGRREDSCLRVDPAAVAALGVQYVVVHADRCPLKIAASSKPPRPTPGCRLVRQIESDYLFEVLR